MEFVNEHTGRVKSIYPTERYSHGGGQMAHRVYVCGGVDGRQIFADLWWLDLRDLSWHCVDTEGVRFGSSSYFQGADISPRGELVTFGGVSSLDTKLRTNEMRTMWLEFPTLEKMAFEALMLRLKRSQLSADKTLDNYATELINVIDYFARNGLHRKLLQQIMPEFTCKHAIVATKEKEDNNGNVICNVN